MIENEILDAEINIKPDLLKFRSKSIIVFVVFVLVNFLLIFFNSFTNYSSINNLAPLYRTVTMFILLIFLFRGKNWAGIIFTVLLLWGKLVLGIKVIGSIVALFFPGIIIYFIGFVYYAYTFYYINIDKNFQLFYNHQRNTNKGKFY